MALSIRGDDSASGAGSASDSGSKIGVILSIIVVALIGATVYLFYQVGQLRTTLLQTREELLGEVSKAHEANTATSQTSRRSVDSLKQEVDEARRQASQLAGQAKMDATKHADDLAAKLEQVQAEQAQRVSAVSTEVSQVKDSANTANTRIGEVSTDVGNVKTDVAATKSELEKTIATLKSAQGDLGVQSGLIATNSNELKALRMLGERNYTEFSVAKSKAPQKVGDVAILLKSTDPKKNRYTISLVADDKTVEKKDKTINEPVQFLVSKATQPYELVVNEVRKDLIKGYISVPKVQQTRN